MAKKISELPAGTISSGTQIPGVEGGVTDRFSVRDLRDIIRNDAGLNHNKQGLSGNVIISGSFASSGNAFVSGSIIIGRGLNDSHLIVGITTLSGTEFLSGHLSVTGNLISSGNIILGKDINTSVKISGSTQMGGEVRIFGYLPVIGSGDFKNSLRVSGSGQFGTPDVLTNFHCFYGNVRFANSGYINGALEVSGNISGTNDFNLVGNGRILGNLGVTGNVTLGSTTSNSFYVYGRQVNNAETVLIGNTAVLSDFGIGGNFRASGDIYLGNTNVDRTFVFGHATFYDKASVSGQFKVSGATELSGTTDARGLVQCRSGLNVSGPVKLSGDRIDLGSDPFHQFHARGSGHIGRDLYVTGNVFVSGAIKAGQGFTNLYVKQCMFDPQIKAGLTDGLYILSGGANAGKIKFQLWRNSSRVQWNSGEFAANDVIFISGADSQLGSPQTRMHKGYNGLYVIQSLYQDATDGGFLLNPTGLPMSPPAVAGLLSGAVPYILVHYKSGWLKNVSGIIPIAGEKLINIAGSPNNGDNQFHHRVIFNQPFGTSDFMCQLTCNQASGYDEGDNDQGNRTIWGRIANVSYVDKNLTTEKVIWANVYDGDATKGDINDVEVNAATKYATNMPTRVWARFEELI